MPRNTIRGTTGQQEANEASGPNSYVSGTGFSLATDLGRVDEALVAIDNASWDARATDEDLNNIIVQVYSEDSAVEAPDDQDFSGDTFSYQAYQL